MTTKPDHPAMPPLSDVPRLPYRQWFPWLAVFRAGGLAIGWPQLAISLAAVMLHWLGIFLFSNWNPSPAEFPDARLREPQLVDIAVTDLGPETRIIEPLWNTSGVAKPFLTLAHPWLSLMDPFTRLVWGETSAGWFYPFFTQLVWNLAVWSLFGVAICRAVAVQIARDQSESLPQAVRYASQRWLGAVGAPSIPAGAMLAIFVGLIVAAWLGRLPWIGGSLLTFLSPILFLSGAAIAFLALVILCGWPLMVAAMGIEDCDGFGALSRTYSFLMGRPAHALWYALISAAYGLALVMLVGSVFTLGLLAESSVMADRLPPEQWRSVLSSSHAWAQLLLATFACSLFWSLATLNYLLLRQAVDQKPFEDISAGVDEEFRGELPVVGIPASDYRSGNHDGQPAIPEVETVVPAT
jgi:hypothetical protein